MAFCVHRHQAYLAVLAAIVHAWQKNSDDSESRTRTKWSEDRTILANERTFSSWMGTGLGCIGVAIGLKAVFGATDPTWVAKLVASIFLLIAVIIFWAARRQARITLERLSSNDVEMQLHNTFTVLATVMTIATLATGAVLWSL